VLTLPPTVRIYIAREPVDCRKSYDGLSALVRSVFGQNPLCGHLFVFINRRADQVQILFFDRTGFCIMKKRLERGTFRLARAPDGEALHVEVDAAELALMLEGIDLSDATKRKRWRAPSTSPSSPHTQA
jgi:transposase